MVVGVDSCLCWNGVTVSMEFEKREKDGLGVEVEEMKLELFLEGFSSLFTI